MGTKYRIEFTRNGLCSYRFDRKTNWFIVALWHFIVLSLKYPIVTFEVRRGYVECEKCKADWCDNSPNFCLQDEKSKSSETD